jgi:hypothetical protein
MPTNTTFLGLKTYNSTTDGSALFQTWRGDVAGTATSSNMMVLDTFAQNISASVVDLQSRKFTVVVPALYSSANYYIANGISQLTSYTVNQIICLSLDTTNSGTVTLNINSLGTKGVQKFDVSGNLVNFEAGELKKNHLYLFKYTGSVWAWIDGTSIDQVGTIGTTNNLLMISPCGVVVDSTITTTGSRISGSYINLVATGVVSGSYNQVQVGADGRITAGSVITSSDANTSLSNLTSASVNVDLNPGTDNTLSLGSTIKSWFYGFINVINFLSGSASTPSASRVVLYNNSGLLESKDSSGDVCFVSQKKKGNFFVVYPNPTVTNGATAASQVELTAGNYTDFTNTGFSNSGSPTGTIDFALPWDYDGGSFTSNFYFRTSGSTSGSSFSVRFGIAGRAYASGDMLDQAPSSFTYVTTTAGSSANQFFISPVSGSFAVSGSPAPLNMIHYVIQRDNSVENNLPSSIGLHGVMINYTRAQN